MANGGDQTGDSPFHTSDSVSYVVLKARKRLLRKRVMRRMLNNVRVKKRDRKAAQNATALRVAVCERLPVYVCFRVCLFL